MTKSNCRGKVAQDEAEHCLAIGLAARDAGDEREQQQEEREQRQQRVVGDRGGEGQIVAVVDADDAAPDGERGQPDLAADAQEARDGDTAGRCGRGQTVVGASAWWRLLVARPPYVAGAGGALTRRSYRGRSWRRLSAPLVPRRACVSGEQPRRAAAAVERVAGEPPRHAAQRRRLEDVERRADARRRRSAMLATRSACRSVMRCMARTASSAISYQSDADS